MIKGNAEEIKKGLTNEKTKTSIMSLKHFKSIKSILLVVTSNYDVLVCRQFKYIFIIKSLNQSKHILRINYIYIDLSVNSKKEIY